MRPTCSPFLAPMIFSLMIWVMICREREKFDGFVFIEAPTSPSKLVDIEGVFDDGQWVVVIVTH